MHRQDFKPQWRVPTNADLVRVGVFLAVVALMAWLSGCGGGPTVPPPGPTPTPVATPTPFPTPVACPSPTTCPPARVWKIGIRECADVPFGESCLMDTTPFWVGGRCNEEDRSACTNECGAFRECEPDWDRGPDFFIVSGESNIDGWVRNPANAYQIRLLRVRGRVKVRACWPEGATDQLGVPLDLSESSCGEVTVEPVR